MLSRETPRAWRSGYALHRRKLRTDQYGEQEAYFDMDTPDMTAEDGSAAGVCWQEPRTWQSGGQMSGGLRQDEQGETEQIALQGALFGSVELSVGDRLVVRGAVYELRHVQQWPGHRMLQLQLLYPAKREEAET